MGIFITFEGTDGCGKTSAMQAVAEKLQQNGIEVVCTREPGGSKVAEQIRNILLDVRNKEIGSLTEMFLYAASRSQHLKDIVIPNLAKGKVVLCDRFVDSSYVYQGLARGIGLDEVTRINELAVGPYMPGLTILVDLKPEICMERIQKNNREKDRLDLEKMDFHQKVYEGYMEIAETYKNRIVVINGNQSQEEVANDSYLAVMKYIRGKTNEGIL